MTLRDPWRLIRSAEAKQKYTIFYTQIFRVIADQCEQIWRNFVTLAIFSEVYLVFDNILSELWIKIYAIEQIFIVVNGQISKKS